MGGVVIVVGSGGAPTSRGGARAFLFVDVGDGVRCVLLCYGYIDSDDGNKVSTRNISCTIHVPKDSKLGSYSNAFRILPDSEGEYLLDFLLYSEIEEEATVVARVRMSHDVLKMVGSQLDLVLKQEEKFLVFSPSNDEIH